MSATGLRASESEEFEKHWDDEQKQWYYYNPKTEVSTWELPPGAKVLEPEPEKDVLAPMREASSNLWEEHYDEDHKKPYYHNPKTGETDWELPPGAQVTRPEAEPMTPLAGSHTPSALDAQGLMPLFPPTRINLDPAQAPAPQQQTIEAHEHLEPTVLSGSGAESLKPQFQQDAQEAEELEQQGKLQEAEKLYRKAAAGAMDEIKSKSYTPESAMGKIILKGAQDWIQKSRAIEQQLKSKHFQNVVSELVETETRYNTNLKTLKKAYLAPLDEDLESLDPVISQEDAHKLTGNLKEIIKHSDNLLSDLTSKSKTVEQTLELSMQYVSIYEEYCVRLSDAMDLLQKLKAENEGFKHFLQRDVVGTTALTSVDAMESMEPGGKVQPIDFYLIEPFQRVLRYKMLLERLIKHTPPSSKEAKRRLEAALEHVSKVADRANEETRKKEQRVNLRRLQGALENAEGINRNAKCLKQGSLSRIPRNWWNGKLQLEDPQKRWYYLFDSGLVVSEATHSAAEEAGFFSAFASQIEFQIMRRVRDATDEELGENKFAARKMFVVEFDSQHEVLEAGTSAEREEWVTELRKTSFKLHISRSMREGKSIEQIFTSFDKNKDGQLDEQEFVAALRSIDQSIDERAAREIMKSFDSDGDGKVDLAEFKKAAQSYQTKKNKFFDQSNQKDRRPKPPPLTPYDKARRIVCCFTGCGCGTCFLITFLIGWFVSWLISLMSHLVKSMSNNPNRGTERRHSKNNCGPLLPYCTLYALDPPNAPTSSPKPSDLLPDRKGSQNSETRDQRCKWALELNLKYLSSVP